MQKNTWLTNFRKNWTYMKTIPKEERLSFLWDYYKVAIVTAAAALLLCVVVIGTVGKTLSGAMRTEQNISLAIAADSVGECSDWVQTLSERVLGGTPVDLLRTSGYYEGNAEFEIELVCWLSARQPDLLICDEATLRYCENQGILVDLAPALSLDAETYWSDISHTAFAKTWAEEDARLYLCRIINSAGPEETVVALIHGILEE